MQFYIGSGSCARFISDSFRAMPWQKEDEEEEERFFSFFRRFAAHTFSNIWRGGEPEVEKEKGGKEKDEENSEGDRRRANKKCEKTKEAKEAKRKRDHTHRYI